MTDRFKFRVWDNLDEKYYEDDCFQIQIKSSGDLFIIGTGNDGEDCIWETDNVIVEQCTGLKDKNGKLIYEGDILNSLYRNDGCKGLYRIVWCEGRLLPKKFGNHQQKQVTVHLTDLKRCEVIGNIHENADLLGEDK